MRFKDGHLLGLEYVDRDDIELILKTAASFREVLERPIKKVPTLQGKTVVNLFFENSTRTRISFELAEKRLSADSVNFSSSTSSVKKGETLLVLEAMKMENSLKSPASGKIKKIHCERGKAVEKNQLLIAFE